jgi:magnesium-transporting ATPase (P-type)
LVATRHFVPTGQQGAILRGCAQAAVVAVFTGRDTRASLSRGTARLKRTRLDGELDRSVLFVFALQLALAAAGGVAATLASPGDAAHYLGIDSAWERLPFIYFLRFILLFSLFIPVSAQVRQRSDISLFPLIVCHTQVTVVVAKYILSTRGLSGGRANHTGLIDELGRVDVVCADKVMRVVQVYLHSQTCD